MINIIEFPALNLSFEINRIAFSFLGKDVYWYGILIGLGVFLAAWYVVRRIDVFGFTAINSDLYGPIPDGLNFNDSSNTSCYHND